MHDDRVLTCSDCGAEFTFTAGEQQFYEERGFKFPPRRCKDCRRKRKDSDAGGGGGGGGHRPQRSHGGGDRGDRGGSGGNRQTWPATCSSCGAETTVPFEPDPARATFCRDCYQQRRKSR